MSGYLQRLATRAMQPVETVHPLLGSVFSDARPEAGAKVFPQEEEIVVSSSDKMFAAISRPESEPEKDDVEPSRRESPANVEPAKAPLVLQTREPNPALRPRQAAPQPQRRTLEEVRKHDVVEHVYAPLIKPTVATPQELSAHQPHANGSSRPRQQAATSRRPPRTEPDEIQIHIGRIEVTAVPQASARSVSKPTRKGMSLEEYLKARDRRA